MLRKFELFERVEKLSPDVFAKVKNDRKVISANVDFYSGLVYEMLGIPSDLYTPMFAVSRIAGLVRTPHRGNGNLRPHYAPRIPLLDA